MALDIRHSSLGLGTAGVLLRLGPLLTRLLNIQIGLEMLVWTASEALVEERFLARCQGGFGTRAPA